MRAGGSPKWGASNVQSADTSLHIRMSTTRPSCARAACACLIRRLSRKRRWVPKVGRKYVRPADICFYDTIEYDPVRLHASPYRLNVTSELPLLGDKVRRAAFPLLGSYRDENKISMKNWRKWVRSVLS